MDEFTTNHLRAWMENHIYDEGNERERFESWVNAQVEDDPTYLDNVPWSSVYKSFQIARDRSLRTREGGR